MAGGVTRIDESKVKETFDAHCIDLVSAGLGGKVIAVSDEWFAPASNLLTVAPPIRKPGVFVHTGAWYDGWESKRHNQEWADWVIIKLGVASGRVFGCEVDTAFFSGNHAPEISVEGIFHTGDDEPTKDSKWEEIVGVQECGPSQRHVYLLDKPTDKAYTHVKLNMIPDGGIARFRLYGQAVPVFPQDLSQVIDLAHVSSGGLAVACSDQHFGKKDNLLHPNRGKDMGDGWETARSREKGHTDWVIVKLGAPGTIQGVTVDTAHFRGNYPQKVKIEAINWQKPDANPSHEDDGWTKIVDPSPCKSDFEHHFTIDGEGADLFQAVEGQVFSHVKMTIIPDGGVSRLRVYGKRAAQ